MASNKEFLTDILDGVVAVQQFLSEGLSKESLSPGCEVQRKNALLALDTITKKIQSSHPSIRPRVNTPGKINKPILSPPIPATVLSKPPPIQEDGELYEDPSAEGSPLASDYLSFYPASGEQVDNELEENGEEQEMYEAMEASQQQQEDAADDEQAENYEDPVLSRPNHVSTTSLPPPSFQPPAPPMQVQVQGLFDGEYATTTGMGREEQFEESMAMDWGNVYTTPPKGEKLKVKDLNNVKIKGPLEKLGGRNRKTWQKRYCVLAGALMYFYEKEGSKSYNNCIALPSFTASLAPNITDTNKHFGFKLTHEDKSTGKHKDYYFRTTSTELRDKWLSCIQNVEGGTAISLFPPRNVGAITTLPRMPSTQTSNSTTPLLLGDRKRAQSLGEVVEEGELYEDMAVTEEDKHSDEDEDEEYVAVEPGQDQDKMSSSEEYVDVVPQEDVEQEEYEEPSSLLPPPPRSPPPGPPSDIFVPPPTQPKAASRTPAPRTKAPAPVPAPVPAPPPPEPVVDTSKVYTHNNIPLDKVYVSQWDFAAGEEDELRLQRGDLVLVNKPLDAELWWYGELLDAEASKKLGPAGFFPKDYSTLAFETASS